MDPASAIIAGQRAYEAYREYWLRISLGHSALLPGWGVMNNQQRWAWATVVLAVESQLSRGTADAEKEIEALTHEVLTMRSSIARLNGELGAADRRIAELKEELSKRPQIRPSPPSPIPGGEHIPWRTIRPLQPEDIFQRVQAEALWFADQCAEEYFSVLQALNRETTEEFTTILGRCTGFPDKEKRNPGVWSLRGL
jgi:hypothetical protein